MRYRHISGSTLQQIRPSLFGSAGGFFVTVDVDLFMVATSRRIFRDSHSIELGGTGIGRCIKQAILEGIHEGAFGVVHGSGQQAHDGIDEDASREFPAGEDVIADGNFFGDPSLADALVHAFVMAAKNDEIIFHGERIGDGLRELLAIGRHKNAVVVLALIGKFLENSEERFGFENHSRTAAKGFIVNLMIFPEAIFAQIVRNYFDHALFAGAFYDAFGKQSFRAISERESGDNIDTHE